MSLLTSCNLANPTNAHWVANDGTDAAPVISGNPVQLCTGGPTASASGVANAINSITSAGTNTATAVLRLGTVAQPDALVLGPQSGGIAQGVLTAQVSMAANANISCGAFSQFLCETGGQVYLESGSEIDVQPGATVKFNNAGSVRGTFRNSTALPTPIPDATTQILANPPLIVEGAYAVMIDTPAGDGQQARQVSTVAYWTGVEWVGGAMLGLNNLQIVPSNDRTSLNLVNGTGGALTNLSVSFVQLVGAAS